MQIPAYFFFSGASRSSRTWPAAIIPATGGTKDTLPTAGLLQGSGDVIWASMTSFSTLGLRVAVAYAMVYLFDVGYHACWWNIPFGWGLGCLLSIPRYFSGAWKSKRVVGDPGEEALSRSVQ